MPSEGMEWVPRAEILTFEEIHRLTSVMVEQFGIESVRLTGGEPTVRANIAVLIELLSRLPVDLSLTTNGSTLGSLADDLAGAGLRRINVSCDSLDRTRFAEITRRDDLARVLEGIDAAVAAGLDPVKVNVVLMRGRNDDEILDWVAFARDHGVVVRFIEFMPLDAGDGWSGQDVVGYDEILATIRTRHSLQPLHRGASPAERFGLDDGTEIGVIPTVTRKFCDTCDRVRLTAEGAFKTCLFGLDEHDLRTPLRAGASDAELAAVIAAAVGDKWAGHGIGTVHFIRPARSMSQIGG
jgi:cyclic pyranopterin phosphate synthase